MLREEAEKQIENIALYAAPDAEVKERQNAAGNPYEFLKVQVGKPRFKFDTPAGIECNDRVSGKLPEKFGLEYLPALRHSDFAAKPQEIKFALSSVRKKLCEPYTYDFADLSDEEFFKEVADTFDGKNVAGELRNSIIDRLVSLKTEEDVRREEEEERLRKEREEQRRNASSAGKEESTINVQKDRSSIVNFVVVGRSTARDKSIVCRSCGKSFIFTGEEQSFYKDHGFGEPTRCPDCRMNRKAERRANTTVSSTAKPAAPYVSAKAYTKSSSGKLAKFGFAINNIIMLLLLFFNVQSANRGIAFWSVWYAVAIPVMILVDKFMLRSVPGGARSGGYGIFIYIVMIVCCVWMIILNRFMTMIYYIVATALTLAFMKLVFKFYRKTSTLTPIVVTVCFLILFSFNISLSFYVIQYIRSSGFGFGALIKVLLENLLSTNLVVMLAPMLLLMAYYLVKRKDYKYKGKIARIVITAIVCVAFIGLALSLPHIYYHYM